MVSFATDFLFSKWGNEDGEILDDLIYETLERHGMGNRYVSFDDEQLLWDVVTTHVIPHLTPTPVGVIKMSTMHNPVRFETSLTDGPPEGTFSPTQVTVPDEVIVAMIEARLPIDTTGTDGARRALPGP